MQIERDILVKLPTGTWRVDALGRWYPDIRGGEGPDDDGGDDQDDDGDNNTPAPEKTYTQRDLNRIAKREKEQGKKAAFQAVADDLGMSLEDAKAFIEEARSKVSKDDEDSNKSLTRAKEKEARAAQLLNDAIEIRNTSKVVAKLVRAGMEPKAAERLGSTVNLDLTNDDLDDDDIADAVDEMREEMPTLFPSTETPATNLPGAPRPPKDSTPRGERRTAVKGSDLAARGRAKLLELHGELPSHLNPT